MEPRHVIDAREVADEVRPVIGGRVIRRGDLVYPLGDRGARGRFIGLSPAGCLWVAWNLDEYTRRLEAFFRVWDAHTFAN